jgi:hypothetical protein
VRYEPQGKRGAGTRQRRGHVEQCEVGTCKLLAEPCCAPSSPQGTEGANRCALFACRLLCVTRGDAYRPDFSPDNYVVAFYVPHDIPKAPCPSLSCTLVPATESTLPGQEPASRLDALPCVQQAARLADTALGPEGYGQFGGGLEGVFVADCSLLMREWPREASSRGLGPVLKPVARLLTKLNPSGVSLFAQVPCPHTLCEYFVLGPARSGSSLSEE